MNRSGVVSLQLAFVSLCRKKGRWKSALFYLFIVELCLISSARVTVTASHFSLWPSLLKKVLLVAM